MYNSSPANRRLGFLRRNLKNAPAIRKETAYFSLVRSVGLLKYSSTVWDPHLNKDIHSLEMAHRRAARFVKNNYGQTSSVTQMLTELGWESFADRRRQPRLVLLYKIINHLAAISVESILIPADSKTHANHQFKYKHLQANTSVQEFLLCGSFTILEQSSSRNCGECNCDNFSTENWPTPITSLNSHPGVSHPCDTPGGRFADYHPDPNAGGSRPTCNSRT